MHTPQLRCGLSIHADHGSNAPQGKSCANPLCNESRGQILGNCAMNVVDGLWDRPWDEYPTAQHCQDLFLLAEMNGAVTREGPTKGNVRKRNPVHVTDQPCRADCTGCIQE